jgi:hypothetical protein
VPTEGPTNPYEQRIEAFVKVFLATMGSTSAPGVPEPMRVGSPDEYGWSAWRPVESPIKEKDIAAIERFIGAKLPPLFKAYLTHKALLMTNFGILSLPEIRSDRPLEDVRAYLNLLATDPYLRSRGYVPFGQEGNGGGPLCFDTKRPNGEGDYPIMYVDHEREREAGYVGVQMWDSFAHLLDDVQRSLLSFRKR